MKNKNTKVLAASMVLLGGLFCSPNTFADNSFGINYTGGSQLGASNVQIEPAFVNSLRPLLQAESVNTVFDQDNFWGSGYVNDGEFGCVPFSYFTVPSAPPRGPASYPHVSFSNNQFRIELDILNVETENVDPTSTIPIGIAHGTSYVYVGWQVYSDSACQVAQTDLTLLQRASGSKVFVEMEASLYEKNSETPYRAKELYLGLTDIDAGQSYKVLNEDSLLKTTTMYAKSAEALQSQDPEVTFKNMFVPSGNYIYSQYGSDSWLNIPKDSDIYATLGSNTQTDGLHFVFGFVGPAASGIEYYATPFNVQYKADENGSITGITGEEVFFGKNPSSSSYQAKEKYVFSHWVADVDVTLQNGTTIKAGDPITSEQIKRVAVDQDIVFTAIFETESPAVPNTGASTMRNNATQITISVFGVLLGALLIRSLPRLVHRKVDFNK